MGYAQISNNLYNIPTVRVWDEETEPCLSLIFDPKILRYHSLEYRTEFEFGTYAYGTDIKDLKQIREQLIKIGRFKPTEVTFGTIPNIPAIIKLEGKKKEQ